MDVEGHIRHDEVQEINGTGQQFHILEQFVSFARLGNDKTLE
jgi:hypothetical protein